MLSVRMRADDARGRTPAAPRYSALPRAAPRKALARAVEQLLYLCTERTVRQDPLLQQAVVIGIRPDRHCARGARRLPCRSDAPCLLMERSGFAAADDEERGRSAGSDPVNRRLHLRRPDIEPEFVVDAGCDQRREVVDAAQRDHSIDGLRARTEFGPARERQFDREVRAGGMTRGDQRARRLAQRRQMIEHARHQRTRRIHQFGQRDRRAQRIVDQRDVVPAPRERGSDEAKRRLVARLPVAGVEVQQRAEWWTGRLAARAKKIEALPLVRPVAQVQRAPWLNGRRPRLVLHEQFGEAGPHLAVEILELRIVGGHGALRGTPRPAQAVTTDSIGSNATCPPTTVQRTRPGSCFPSNGVCLPWLRSAAGCTVHPSSGAKMHRSARPPTAMRPTLACSVPSAAPSTRAGPAVSTASARERSAPPPSLHLSARLSSSSTPVAPGSASANGSVLPFSSTGVWSDTSASIVPSASAPRSASRSRCWRSGGFSRARASE